MFALALDPFSQHILQLQERIKYTASDIRGDLPAVSTTRAETYHKGRITRDNMTQSKEKRDGNKAVVAINMELPLTMQAAVLNGLARDNEMIKQQGTVTCPTGIRSWDQFQSLGVCSRCRNLTADLKRVDNLGSVYNEVYTRIGGVFRKKDGTEFILPNGHFLMNINGCAVVTHSGFCDYNSAMNGNLPTSKLLMSSYGTGHSNKINTQDIDTLIWSMSMIHMNSEIIDNPDDTKDKHDYKWPDIPLLASECALYWCVQTLDARLDGNIMHANITQDTDAVRDQKSWNFDFAMPMDDMIPENKSPDSELNSLVFDPYYSYINRSDLVLHFPNNDSKPSTQSTAVPSSQLTKSSSISFPKTSWAEPTSGPRWQTCCRNARSDITDLRTVWEAPFHTPYLSCGNQGMETSPTRSTLSPQA